VSNLRLDEIRKKVDAAERLSAADGEYLFSPEADLHEVGRLADAAGRRQIGQSASGSGILPLHDAAGCRLYPVYYNRNAHINPTNVCIYRCALCAYSRDEDDPQAYTMSDAQLLAAAQEAADAGCTELHVVGGAHPAKKFDWYLGITRRLHEAFPRLHLKAWTATEIDYFARLSGLSIRRALEELVAAGLGSMPAGGAEIFDSQVRTEICPRKADAKTWLEIHRTAHQLGLRTNASMLYGHIESAEHRIDHLCRLRDLQAATGGFQAFVPLKFHPAGTAMSRLSPVSALEDLRVVAVSRLMLDNFDHVKAYWISLGIGTAQTALAYGADDLDGTIRRERIHHAAGAATPEFLAVDQIRALIAETGRQPVERDSLYRPVLRNPDDTIQ
jgi:aminodeoxyfutalosine synthase